MIELPGGALVDIPETALEVGAVTIHEHKAPARLIERWKNKDNFRALQRTYLPEIREVENALWLVWVSRFVDYAADEQLDLLGRIVGERRQGRTDPNYRLRIKARILINKSFGTADDILGMLGVIESAQARITEFEPASFRVDFDGPLQGVASLTEIAGLVSEARAAGIGGAVIAPTDEALGLRWGDATDPLRKFSVTAGTAVNVAPAGDLPVDVTATAGALLVLHVCDESGDDYPLPSGWTLRENRLLNVTGPARHKVWTRVHAGGSALTTLSHVGAARAIARMYAVYGPSLTIAGVTHVEGTGTTPTTAGATQLARSLVFTGYDSGGTLSTYVAGAKQWTVIGSATAGSAAGGVGVHAHVAFRDDAALAGGAASNSDTAAWGTITVELTPETLGGWNYGLLADRRLS